MATEANRMYAEFLMDEARLGAILNKSVEKGGSKSRLKIGRVGNGRISSATGPTQEVMFLIGDVAAEGEDCLYRAMVL